MKWIGITQRLLENTSYYEVREALSVEWGKFFKEHLQGFLPLPLSYAIPFSAYAESLGENLSGVILSGGNDLNSLNPNPLSAMRDEYEAQIIEYCLQHNLPLLGICRGAQRIAEYFGAKLELLSGHIGNHQVFDICSGEKFEVNSFHNYGIINLNTDLEPLSIAEDKSLESFKHLLNPIFGIMWHIERNEKMLADTAIKQWKQILDERT